MESNLFDRKVSFCSSHQRVFPEVAGGLPPLGDEQHALPLHRRVRRVRELKVVFTDLGSCKRVVPALWVIIEYLGFVSNYRKCS